MKIVSWNLEGRLSDLARDERGTPERIVRAIRAFDADVYVHPEAFGSDPAPTRAVEEQLAGLGYESISVAYDDADSRGERAVVPDPHLRVMSRLAISHSEVIRPGGLRNMLSVTVRDPESERDIRVIGVHLEDRSEAQRLAQAKPLVDYINRSDMPTVVCGDFNAMPPDTLSSRLIHSRAFKAAGRLAPSDHARYTLERLSEMATGSTIGTILRGTRLINTDPEFKPTTTPKMRRMESLPSIRLAKIDWLFVSPDVTYSDFAVSRDLGSDHRALIIDLRFRQD